MKKIILVLFLIFGFHTTMSQNSNRIGERQLGLKVGYVVGVSYEQFISNHSSLEGTFEYDFSNKGLTVMPLYKYHFWIGSNFGLNLGGGVNFSWYNLKYKPKFVLGFNPSVGVDYIFSSVSLGVYYRPQLNISYLSNWANFGVRFGINL